MKFLAPLVGFLTLASMAQAAPPKTVVGYLGQATARTSIFASPNTHSRRYSRVHDKQYLVVRPYSETWEKVLLYRGIYGYVKTAAVKNLPYEVSLRGAGQRGGIGIPIEQGDLASRSGMAQYALNYIGRVPYRWGGTDVNSGIDCSGFVREMYGKIGVRLPRTAAEQAFVGQPIYRLEELQPGDRLYFWDSKRGMIGHTGIYEGGGYFVHSSHGKNGVATSYLSDTWRRILVAARR